MVRKQVERIKGVGRGLGKGREVKGREKWGREGREGGEEINKT